MEKIFVSHIKHCRWQQRLEFRNFRWKYLVDSSENNCHGLSCGLVEIPVGEELELHSHSPQEIYLIRSGEGLLLRGDLENKKLSKDSIVYIPGKQSHGLRNSGKVPLEVIWIFPTDCWEDVKYVFDK
ncbi:MAG: cupin domain-containing protein [Paracoccaceae bacterium]|nr:cupin domain-containing protein [Paracoccaceae bacterium]